MEKESGGENCITSPGLGVQAAVPSPVLCTYPSYPVLQSLVLAFRTVLRAQVQMQRWLVYFWMVAGCLLLGCSPSQDLPNTGDGRGQPRSAELTLRLPVLCPWVLRLTPTLGALTRLAWALP